MSSEHPPHWGREFLKPVNFVTTIFGVLGVVGVVFGFYAYYQTSDLMRKDKMAEPPEIDSAEQQKEFFWLLGIGITMWALRGATVWPLRSNP
jgi:hypothetical protein